MSQNGKGRRRWLRLIALALIVTGVILGGLTLVLRLRFHGPALARLVEQEMNTRIRGRVKIGSVEWAMSDLPGLAVNGWMPVVIRDAKVYDADNVLVIEAPLVTAEIDGHAGAFGDRELMVRNLVIPDGGRCRIRNVLSPEGDNYAVSLTTAFRSPSPPSFTAGQTSRGGPLIDLHDYEVRNATLEFEFPQFTAHAEHVNGKGMLHFDGTDPLVPRLYFKLSPTTGHSVLTVGELVFDIAKLDVETLELRDDKGGTDGVPHDLVYVANALGTDGAEYAVKGRIRRFWTDRVGDAHDIDLDIANGGPMARRLFGILGGGDDLTIHLDVEGPTINPRVTVTAHRLGLDLPLSPPETATAEAAPAADSLPLIVDKGQLVFDLATESGTVDDAVIAGMGGEIRGSVLFTIRPMSFDAEAEVTRPLDLAPRLPPRVAKMAGTKLSGRLHARGTRVGQKLDPIDLRLGRAHVTGAVTRNAAGVVYAENVTATLDRTTVRELNGRIDLPQRSVDLAFGVKSTDLARWLRLFDAPAFATAVSGRGRVHGSFDDIRARGDLTASGVPVFARVDADLSYEKRTLVVHEAQSGAFDGWVRGSGRIHLDGGAPRLEAGEAQAVRVDLSRLPGVGPMLTGRASGTIKADGRLTALRADASAQLSGLQIGGEPYRDTTVQFAAEPDGQKSVNAHLERIAGGKLDIAASVDSRRRLGGALSLRDLPFESLAEVTGVSSDVAGGEIGAEVQLSGTLDAPTGDGYVSLARAYLREAFFGNANIEFERAGDGLVRVSGQILQGRVKVEGTIETRAPFVADVALKLRRVEIDQFLPAIAARASARGWVSGEVRWKAPLLLRPGDRPSISANLSEIVAVIDSEDASGRPSPIRLRNRSPIAFTYDGVQLTLLEDAIIAGPTGDFVLSGAGSQRSLGFKISGKVSVQLLEPYFRHLFEGMDGMLDIEVALGGSLEDWRVSGVLEIQDVAVKPLGQDAIVTVPHGKILFDNDQVAITGVDVEVIDEFSDEHAKLSVAGGVKLRDMKPAQWAIRIEGDLAGKMLLVAAPSLFSAAAGKAQISLALLGSGEMPDIDGTIDLAPAETRKDQVVTPLTFTPRGLRREIALTGGTIRFTGDLVELERVSGTVDDEGEILDVSGDISLASWKPESVDLTLSARGLPFRVPQTLDMSVNLERLEIVGGASGTGRGLEINGTAEIVDGRYIRKWRPVLDAFKQVRTTETALPFYEAIPMLGSAQLKIALDVRSFYIRNNMASIDLSGDLVIAGTPRRPRFEGVVRVEQGEFKFQGVRAKFSRTNGTVTFSPFKEFPKDTPYLDIHSESDYRDLSGQDHLVVLSLSGPISNLNWDLGTAAGLNKAQTMTLILAGRRPDEARQALLGEEGIGRRPGDFAGTRTTAANDSSLAAATDELAKDLAGDIFSLLIEDPIKNFTTLDVARLEIGSQLSVGFHGEKEVTESLRLLGDAERSLRGWTWDVRGQYRMTDNVSLDAEHLRKQFDDDAEEDENKTSIKLTWRRVLLP